FITLSHFGLFVLLRWGLSEHWGTATVVEDFNHVERCKDSLYMGTPPRGFRDSRLKKICQRYADKPRYVTLYDSKNRIPVYSAYTFKKTEGDRRVDYPWMYEPQLAELDGNGNMLPFPTGYLHMKFEDSQAILDDYSDVVLYERGHLNPDQHQSDPQDRAATYTLTNVVPEIPHPCAPQQFLPGNSLHCNWGNHYWKHDPTQQPGPCCHP
uniref:DNA/RNA non-specific endonuclease/pyrophosphatase/phosphodiesterase domain-containing protein n=1 Tax=Cyprinus carpio TaxID=7962 RepID=A0A8C1K0V5_CYPCA